MTYRRIDGLTARRTAALLALTSSMGGAACSSTPSTGTGGSGGTTSSTSTTTSSSTSAGGGGAGGGQGSVDIAASVLQHHKNPSRDGVYVEPTITLQAAAGMHLDPSFAGVLQGASYAQPLYLASATGDKDRVFATTEENWVYALDAETGAELWKTQIGEPVPLNKLPCGNINPLGITGTPVIDPVGRTIYADGMTSPDGGISKRHLIVGLSVDDGSMRPGFPIDVSSLASAGGKSLASAVHNQRGALIIVNGVLYVPYGGHYGDCGTYYGWVVGVPLDKPAMVQAWATAAKGGGSWAPGGVSSDGSAMFVATGNTFGASSWSGGEAIIKLGAGPTFSNTPADYFAPTDWKALDAGDVDIGGSGPVLFDLPGATPSKLVIALGKNGKAYVIDRGNLGGVSKALAEGSVSSSEIINAASVYRTPGGTFVAFKGKAPTCNGGPDDQLSTLKIVPGAPPTLAQAWCVNPNGLGSPMTTTTDGLADAVVWTLGAEGDGRLHGYDGSTGAVVFAGGGASDKMTGLKRYSTPIAAKGRLFVAASDRVYAFTSP